MAQKTITVCDGCGKEIKSNGDHYELHFKSKRFTDAAGSRDWNDVNLEFCESCTNNLKASLRKIAERGTE